MLSLKQDLRDRTHCGVDKIDPDKIKTMSLSHWFMSCLPKKFLVLPNTKCSAKILRRKCFTLLNQTSNQRPRRVTCRERGLQGAPMPPDQRNKSPPHPP